MDGVYLLIATFFIIAVILVTVVLVLLHKHRYTSFQKEVEQLDKQKNIIASTPVLSELSKVESIVKNNKMEEKYKNWQKRFEVIKNERVNLINDMITDLDISVSQKHYQNFDQKIAKVEMEIYKVRESANELLNEIQELTVSDEKYRSILTKLKAKYRELTSEFNINKTDYGDIVETIELQFETIEKRFLDFERIMEKNEYDEANHIIKALDTMIDHMSMVIKDVPDLVLMSEKLIPKRIEEILSTFRQMTSEGYNLDYLNISYNMEECNKNVSIILDRVRVLNLDDCMFELKTLLDYTDNILNDFEKEKLAKRTYQEIVSQFDSKLKTVNGIVKGIFKQMDDIKNMYDLKDDDIKEIDYVKMCLEKVKKDYRKLLKQVENRINPYSDFVKQIESLLISIREIENNLDGSLKSLGSMQEDEVRAREQLVEIEELLRECKYRIRSYKLPIIVNNYFVELSEANDAIIEIIRELDRKPIVIKVLNTRVDTARDLVLKLYNTTNDMIKTAQLAEMAIVYGNRYRSEITEIDRGLENAEMLYLKGNYKEALETGLSSIQMIEPDIHSKLIDIYREN